ncbi:MAG TPA: anti-virulence regulator CigR family protein [Longimicrobiales bacterium]|nr:anti-virulence regulator CigR family protein [Longimicrobiales bacterium]
MIRRTSRPVSVLFLPVALSLCVAAPASAQSKGKDRGGSGVSVGVQAEIVFSHGERAAIVEFFDGNPMSEVKPLPPGIRKNLARGKPLPPGIAKKTLPQGLEGGLPVREGYQRVVVGLDVLLVEVATGIVRDILWDVIH